jgi:hypothetical protein
MDKRVTFPESVEDAKKCVPGPNVVFRKKDLPYSQYLSNIDKRGSLGCGPNKYPKYENGKYCCVDVMSTNQEILDYINNLLENAMDVTGISSFNKEASNIEWLISIRDNLLKNYKDLTDNISVPQPFTSVEDWFNQNIKDLKYVSRFGSEPVDIEIMESKTDPRDKQAYRQNILNRIARGEPPEEEYMNLSVDPDNYQRIDSVENTRPKGCFGKFCETLGIRRNGGRNGGRKTKRLRKKYKKTRNIKKRQIKKRALSKKTN